MEKGKFGWDDLLKFGSIVFSIALSAGMLMSQLENVRGLVQDQKEDIKAASTAVQSLQIESAKRSAEYLLLDRRMSQIESRLNRNR